MLVESPRSLTTLELVSVNFIPRISGVSSCDGSGLMVLELKGSGEGKSLKGLGFLLKERHESSRAVIPEELLAAYSVKKGVATISWAWTWAEPEDDGKFKWEFTVQPVNKAGTVGEALELCIVQSGECNEI